MSVFDWDNWNWDDGSVWGPIDATPMAPVAVIIPAYPYLQYSDDPNICAFFTAFNLLAQTYLDWFNQTGLAVYTLATVNGPLLDWTLQGIYGLERPVFSSLNDRFIAGLNSRPLNSAAINSSQSLQSGTATVATDDYYKRVATWIAYLGNARFFNLQWLRWRVARFIYGSNGSDITIDQMQTVHILAGLLAPPPAPSLSSESGGTLPPANYAVRTTYVTPVGETTPSAPSTLNLGTGELLICDSPPVGNGASGWNVYVATLPVFPARFEAGINSGPLNGWATNGTNLPPITWEKQNTEPLAIGTNWIEPTTGLIVGGLPPNSNTSNTDTNLIITVPNAQQPASTYFQQAFEQGLLAFPFQLTADVVIA